MCPTANSTESIQRARRLRRAMTDGERKLWSELRNFRRWYGVHVRKQAPIDPYIVDFAIHEQKLVIEVDGESHFSGAGVMRDKIRDTWLAGRGYRILRFTTGDLSDSFDGCVQEILAALGLMNEPRQPPPLTPPLKGEGDLEA
ncbi:endonuclease domain-containing protein [Mesorhizobium sp. CN5-321]|uniref:endonuclease domain-containing protein n=1 Tax=Mesorhizobium hunchu TaxID=3157708 RepID=UPI0032B72B1E